MHARRGAVGWRGVFVLATLAGCGGGAGDEGGSASGGAASTSTDAAVPTTDAGTVTTASDGATSTSSSSTSTSTSTAANMSTGDSDEGSSASGEQTGPPPLADVAVFLAQGHYGRTTISCDDGKTWVQDRSEDDAARCFTGDLDCDHNAFAARGIAWGDGQIVLTWGWGAPGTLVRSEDAASFMPVMTETPTFADVAFGNGRFVANNSPTSISDDGGKTWLAGGPLGIDINTRTIEFVPQDGGAFIVTGESGEQRAIARSPDGVTWTPASQRPPECGMSVLGVAHGGDVTVVASGKGFICRSPDAGDTWTQVPVAEGFSAPPVWTGSEFFVYQGNVLHRSATGEVWTSEPLTPASTSIGQVARSPEGTFVAVNDGWQTWYEQQRFFRSTDGKTWEQLAAGTYVGGHPIYFMAHGTVPAGAGCPGG